MPVQVRDLPPSPMPDMSNAASQNAADALAQQIVADARSGAPMLPRSQAYMPNNPTMQPVAGQPTMINYNGTRPDLVSHPFSGPRAYVPLDNLYTQDQYGNMARIQNRALGAPYELPSYGPFRGHVVNAMYLPVTRPLDEELAPAWALAQQALARIGSRPAAPAAPASPASPKPGADTTKKADTTTPAPVAEQVESGGIPDTDNTLPWWGPVAIGASGLLGALLARGRGAKAGVDAARNALGAGAARKALPPGTGTALGRGTAASPVGPTPKPSLPPGGTPNAPDVVRGQALDRQIEQKLQKQYALQQQQVQQHIARGGSPNDAVRVKMPERFQLTPAEQARVNEIIARNASKAPTVVQGAASAGTSAANAGRSLLPSLIRNFGPKTALSLAGKMALRSVPILGWGMLGYDLYNIGRDLYDQYYAGGES